MKAVIPCALKEEQLFPFSETLPTGLMPVMGKPIIEHLITSLRSVGVEEILLIANHKEDLLRERFEDERDVQVVHQEEVDGTGSAVQAVGGLEEDFFVVNGDVIVSERDLENLKNKFEATNPKVSMLAAGEDKPEKFGVLSITNDEVTSIDEKPEEPDNSLVNTGIYLFKPELFEVLDRLDEEETSLVDAVKKMADEEEATFELIEDYWVDIGEPRTLKKADAVKREFEINETEIAETAKVHENVEIIGNAIIEGDVELKPGTVIEGDVYVGEGTSVEPNTRLKNSSISKGSIIDAESVKNSLVFEDNIFDPCVCIENSIIGEESEVRSGTVIRGSFIGARSFVDMNNSVRGVKFVPDARTDISEISK